MYILNCWHAPTPKEGNGCDAKLVTFRPSMRFPVRRFCLLITIMVCSMVLESTAFAVLTNDEYAVLKENPFFVQAEQRLDVAWLQFRALVPKARRAAAIAEHKQWYGAREAKARAAVETGTASMLDVFIAETLKRAMALEKKAAHVSTRARSTIVAKTVPGRFAGQVDSRRDDGVWVLRLLDAKGREVLYLGALGELPEHLVDCLSKAESDRRVIELGGTVNVYKNGARRMALELPVTCE